LKIVGDFVVFGVSEEQEGKDLTGDGDLTDVVLHYANLETGQVSSTGLPVQGYWVGASVALFTVPESHQGRDLNGDGDETDRVLHVLDPRTGTVENLGLDAIDVVTDGDFAAFKVREWVQGEADLNQDGDVNDIVLYTYHPITMATNLEFAVDLTPIQVHSPMVAAAVPEIAQFGADLNGDGDVLDAVLHLFGPSPGVSRNLHRSATTYRFVGANALLFTTLEQSEGYLDLNGDGDTNDAVAFVHRIDSDSTVDLRLATTASAAGGDLAGFAVHEGSQGNEDLNEDGDALDGILVSLDAARGTLVNSRLAAEGYQISEDLIATLVPEQQQGGTDLNGDGNTSDVVPYLFHPATGDSVGLPLAVSSIAFRRDWLYALVGKAQQGTDLNGDGDLDDSVGHLFDRVSQATRNLHLAVNARQALGEDLLVFAARRGPRRSGSGWRRKD
jgi:hypothetical protein